MLQKSLLHVVLLLLLPASVKAQRVDTMIVSLDEILVRENRIKTALAYKPSSITLLDIRNTVSFPADNLPDILHYIPGLDIRSRGVNGIQNDISIRGSTFDQVLMMINGLKISDPQTGHHNFNLPVDLAAIEQVEIYRGPAARVFGQNAFAGAINIITSIPEDNRISAGVSAGDYGLFGGRLSLTFGSIDFRNMLTISHMRSSGYRYNTDYRLSNVFYQSEIFTRAGNISLQGGLSLRDFGANGFYASPDYKDQYEKIATALGSVTFEPRLKNEGIDLSVRFYLRNNNDEYLFIRSDPSYYMNLHSSLVAGSDINMVYRNRLGLTGAGIDINSQSLSSTRLGDHRRTGATLFLDHRVELADGRLSFVPGIQLIWFEGFGSTLLPGLDAGLMITRKNMLFFNSGYTYRIPTYTDLYYVDPVNGSNPSLQPEYAFSNELGIKSVRTKGFSYSFTAFHRNGRNLIDRTRETINELWIPVNINNIIFRGAEASLTLDFDKLVDGSILPLSRFVAGYTYTETSFGSPLPEFSRFALENLKDQFSISLTLRYGQYLTHTSGFRYYNRVNMDD